MKDRASCVMRRVSRRVVRAVFALAVIAGCGSAWADGVGGDSGTWSSGGDRRHDLLGRPADAGDDGVRAVILR